MAVNIDQYEKAVGALRLAHEAEKTDLHRDATIQRFEFTVELAWKVSKKLMGTPTTAPKQVVREMAQNGFITNIETWLIAIDYRNLSAHTYNEDLAKIVYDFVEVFLPLATELLKELKAR